MKIDLIRIYSLDVEYIQEDGQNNLKGDNTHLVSVSIFCVTRKA